jgi:RNA polymerase sigma-70 factor (ECF subfamily)
MDRDELNEHLSEISTAWTVLHRAHGAGPSPGPQSAQAEAQGRLLQRYGAAIYRYLLAATRSRDAADELFQEFALRFVRGDFHRADERRGRFRDFLKTALFHLIVDTQRGRKKPMPLPDRTGRVEPFVESPPLLEEEEADRRFLAVWRGELLARAWDSLALHERETGQPTHTVLRLRTEHPQLRSPEMAERLTSSLGRPVSAVWVRKKLVLAREKFTDALLEAVAQSLAEPTHEALEQELIDLGLVDHCRAALARRVARGTGEKS